jgi:hypothetical protein
VQELWAALLPYVLRASRTVALRLLSEQLDQMIVDDLPQAWDDRVKGSVGSDLGGIEQELLAPDQSGIVTELDDMLEEPTKEGKPQAIADAGQAGMIRERLIQMVPKIPPVCQVEAGLLDQLPL